MSGASILKHSLNPMVSIHLPICMVTKNLTAMPPTPRGAPRIKGLLRAPVGIIKVSPDKDWSNFDDFMTALNHEFTHALEDISLYTLNSDFQDWKKKSPENAAVKTGHEKFQDNFRATGLLMAFNTNSRNSAAYGASQEGDYFKGRYYGHKAEYASDDPARDEAEKTKAKTRHLAQLRERHAYLLEPHNIKAHRSYRACGALQDSTNLYALAVADLSGQRHANLKHQAPHRSGKSPCFDRNVKKIDDLFRHADIFHSTYEERLRSVALGFINAQKLMLQASKDGLLDLEEPPTKAFYLKLKDQITDDRIGLIFWRWKRQLPRQNQNHNQL